MNIELLENKTVFVAGKSSFVGSNLFEMLLHYTSKSFSYDFLFFKVSIGETFFSNKKFNLTKNIFDCGSTVVNIMNRIFPAFFERINYSRNFMSINLSSSINRLHIATNNPNVLNTVV